MSQPLKTTETAGGRPKTKYLRKYLVQRYAGCNGQKHQLLEILQSHD